MIISFRDIHFLFRMLFIRTDGQTVVLWPVPSIVFYDCELNFFLYLQGSVSAPELPYVQKFNFSLYNTSIHTFYLAFICFAPSKINKMAHEGYFCS
jgi:hypothetical protein